MLREIQQVLRLFMLLGKRRRQRGLKTAGGLLVLLWTETGASDQSPTCTVAAAGSWCAGIKIKALRSAMAHLKESVFPCVWPCSRPDPEDLRAFTELYGSQRLLLSFQMKDATLLSPECCAQIETFLQAFSVANAAIKIHLKFKFRQQSFQREFRVISRSKVALPNQPALLLDVTCRVQRPVCEKKEGWCEGGHPVLGGRLPLSIPPEAMDRGLFGDLSVQFVTLLSPCVLQYPNLPTQLTHIQVLVCSPSNVPVTGPSTFFQNLPAHLDYQELGLTSLHCFSLKGYEHSVGTVYMVEQDQREDPDGGWSVPSIQQSLLVVLFLQHSDPFAEQLSDIMATEELIERHLEDVLNNNRQAVTAAIQTELENTLKGRRCREKDQEKLCSAAEVILSSCISIVSCSSNVDFRNACLTSMEVCDTHGLSVSLHESLRRVTSWKFTPRGKCYSTQREDFPQSDEPTSTEI